MQKSITSEARPVPGCIRRGHRRASTYLAVLGTTVLVMVIGLAALAAVRVQRDMTGRSEEAIEARLLAQSGIEWALARMGGGQGWRTQMPANNWITSQPLAGGTMTVAATDPVDGDIANRATDPLLLLGLGVYSRAQYLLQVKLLPVPGPLAALATCLHAQGNVSVNSGLAITVSGGTLSTNGQLIRGGTIYGNVEAAGQSGTGLIHGQITIPAAGKLLPQTSVVDTWMGMATAVGVVSSIDRQVWGAGCTPGGFTNRNGVYYLTSATDLLIRRSRIHGTLVIRCPGRSVRIEDEVFMDAHRQGFPTLIVDGTLDFNGNSSSPLSEADQGINFNPPGAERNGQYDFDTADSYPTEICGLVYATGNIIVNASCKITGVVLCNSSVNFYAPAVLNHDPTFNHAPPVGFLDPAVEMAIQNGSWQRVVLP